MSRILLLILMFLSTSCSGMVVSINLTWSRDISNYDLMEGSVIQVVAYNAGAVQPNPNNSFDSHGMGVYDPYSTPDGHDIIHSSSIGADINPGRRYEYIETFISTMDYDYVYLRIFSSTGFSEEIQLSYWGLGTVRTPSGGTVYYNANNFNPNRSDYFSTALYFEVIPEPSSAALLAIGSVVMVFLRTRRSLLKKCENSIDS